MTNEPTEDRENVTNEPTEVGENATNEPKLAGDRESGDSAEPSASTDDRDGKGPEGGFDREKLNDWIQEGRERIKLARAESLRKLNEEARKEAELAMAARRLRHGGSKNAKLREQPEDREARARQSRKQEITARTETGLERELEMQTPFRANTPGKPSESDRREVEEAVAAYNLAVRRAAERGRRARRTALRPRSVIKRRRKSCHFVPVERHSIVIIWKTCIRTTVFVH